VIDEPRGDAIFVEVPFVLNDAGDDARGANALQRASFPVARMRREPGHRAGRDATSPTDADALFIDAEVQARPVTDMLEVREMCEDLFVQRLKAHSVANVGHDGKSLRPGGPHRYSAQWLDDPGDGLEIARFRPAPQERDRGGRREAVGDQPHAWRRSGVTDLEEIRHKGPRWREHLAP